MRLSVKYIMTLLISIGTFSLQAQQVYRFTLKQAVDFAMENNYDVIYSEKNIEAAKQQMREATAIGLPQLDGAMDYTKNIQRPVSVIPSEDFPGGQPGDVLEIQFGTKHNVNAGLYLNQLVFSGKYIVGLQTAKIFMEKANVDFFRDKVAVRQQVANSYYDVLSTNEALWVVDTTLTVTRNLAEETRKTYEVGFAEDIDVDQLELLVADLEASRVYFENQQNIAHAYLKFYLGLSDLDSLILVDDMQSLVDLQRSSELIASEFNFADNVDYASLEKQKQIRFMQIKLEKTEYMPTLLATLNLQTNAQRETWDFFEGGKWYPSSAFGVNLTVPIWSSGERRARVKQAEIAFEQMEIMEDQLITSLKLQYQTAATEYYNAYLVFLNKEKARKVAEKIFNTTSIKFREGMASSLDILNTQNQYLEAERNYIDAALALLKAGEELERLLTKAQMP
ncbi:MAG: TolC family protein [bacterium]